MNLKEKLLETRRCLLACSLATSLATGSLTGCGEETKQFQYEVNKEGFIDAVGVVEYDYLKNCYILVLNYNDDTKKYFIASVNISGSYRGPIYNEYNDIKNGKSICTVEEEIINSDTICSYEAIPLCDYLTKDDYVKEEYNISDMDKILEDYKNEYGSDNSKKLIKNK